MTELQKEFKKYVREEFDCDVIEVPRDEADTFEKLFKADFMQLHKQGGSKMIKIKDNEKKEILEPTPSKCVDRWVEMYFEEKHRAEIAEEALKLACEKAYDIRVSMDTLSCSSCWLFEEHGMCYTHDKFEAGSECYDKWQEHFIQQAEARLAELKEVQK